ncbi:MAG TPA: hypothetical protein VF085_04175 [Solirubrobacterales bacterium]
MRIASVWGQLSESHRRWIVLRALLAAAAINVVINAAMAWLSVHGQDGVPLWGAPMAETTIIWNVVSTLFLLPLITCVLVTRVVRQEVRQGSLTSLSRLRSAHGWLAALPSTPWRRGVAFGAIAVVVLAPPLTLALAASGFPELTGGQFIACQAAFTAVLGAIVTPVIALYAMVDPPTGPVADLPS